MIFKLLPSFSCGTTPLPVSEIARIDQIFAAIADLFQVPLSSHVRRFAITDLGEGQEADFVCSAHRRFLKYSEMTVVSRRG